MPALLHRTIGEYRLEHFLGAGGMGEVYRGVHRRLGRVVAVKVLTHAEPDATSTARFRNEARIQASLHHKNVARLYEFLEVDGRPCLIMEYVEGPTLARRIAEAGALPAREALRVFQEVVDAVIYLHGRGIIHRDLKPGNVKLCPDGTVKLLDFGISKGSATPRLTRTGNVVGTLPYLSPEQVRGHAADPRSDVWALGVLLYEMVTGLVPFDASNVLDLYARISKAAFLPPRVLNPSVSRQVEAVIGRCLRKKPGDRYASAEELRQDLDRYSGTASSATGRAAVDRIAAALRDRATRLKVLPAGLRRVAGPAAGSVGGGMRSMSWVIGGAGAALAVLIFLVLAWPRADTSETTHTTRSAGTMSVRIDLAEGQAQVFTPDGRLVGQTPYLARAEAGAQLTFVLRREGYKDKPIKIEMSGRRSEYVFPMEKVRE